MILQEHPWGPGQQYYFSHWDLTLQIKMQLRKNKSFYSAFLFIYFFDPGPNVELPALLLLNDSYSFGHYLHIWCKMLHLYSRPPGVIFWLPVTLLCVTHYYLLFSKKDCNLQNIVVHHSKSNKAPNTFCPIKEKYNPSGQKGSFL